MTQPLPPALIRLASALELSSGFLLYFLTGPRDHVDSVFLRLRALTPDFELVRHRIRSAADLDLSDLLATTRDDRPRIVFLSGLETLPTALRRELTERLNLLRDSWAPHPARVVFWLPSWGLGEFRRIAPDLFDWRSGLITLSDADLPIRSELEYLVWACERHGGDRYLPGGPDRWSALAHRLHRLPPHIALMGLDPADRNYTVRNLALGYARDALASEAPRWLSSVDLNTLSRAIMPHGTVAPHTPTPVLIRSQDAAGKLSGEALWMSLARAAAIPGPEIAAPLLADLATHGNLLVLLDGFDRLALDDNDPARHWLEQLTAMTPPIRLIAATTGPPTSFFANWPRRSHELFDDLTADADKLPADLLTLIHLLQVLFPTGEDLVGLASYVLGLETDELPLHEARDLVATALVLALARRGLLDASFFAELTRMRPAHAAEIESVARSFTGP